MALVDPNGGSPDEPAAVVMLVENIASPVSAQVTDVYVLISMRADRRFDAGVAANAVHFDIEEAAKQAFRAFQAAAEHAPESLEPQFDLIESLLSLLARQDVQAAIRQVGRVGLYKLEER